MALKQTDMEMVLGMLFLEGLNYFLLLAWNLTLACFVSSYDISSDNGDRYQIDFRANCIRSSMMGISVARSPFSLEGGKGKIWRRKWQPSPVFLPGKSHKPRSLAGYSLWRHKELDTNEGQSMHSRVKSGPLAKSPKQTISSFVHSFYNALGDMPMHWWAIVFFILHSAFVCGDLERFVDSGIKYVRWWLFFTALFDES